MKTIFKKNQLIITALAALIAVAGYLNHAERKINDDAKQAAANEAQSETTSTVENAEANESAHTDVASGT